MLRCEPGAQQAVTAAENFAAPPHDRQQWNGLMNLVVLLMVQGISYNSSF
jgi:hypothetical protein